MRLPLRFGLRITTSAVCIRLCGSHQRWKRESATTFGAWKNLLDYFRGDVGLACKRRRQILPAQLQLQSNQESRIPSNVLVNKTWARAALAMNALGALLFFYSFQATSSRFRLLSTPDHRYALCVDKTALIKSLPDGGMSLGPSQECPDWEHSKPAAVVNIEKPFLVTVGFVLTFLGFAIQFFSFPSSKTEKELRAEIRRLGIESKSMKDSN